MSEYEFCTDCGADILVSEADNEEPFECEVCGNTPLCHRCMGDHRFLHDKGFEQITV